jgi:hypothetical protein
MDDLAVGAALRQRVEVGARLAVVREGAIKMGGIRLLVDERQKRFECVTYGPDEPMSMGQRLPNAAAWISIWAMRACSGKNWR